MDLNARQLASANKRRVVVFATLGLFVLLIITGATAWLWWNSGRPRPQRIIDLSSFYNGSLSNNLANHGGRYPNYLLEMPQGTNVFAGVTFAVDGIMQLRSSPRNFKRGPLNMPDRFDDIPIRRRCQQIHMLHGVVYKPDGIRPVAYLEVHYRSGATNLIPVVYTRHVRDCWFKDEPNAVTDPNTAHAWIGSNPLSRANNNRVRVFRTTFNNPRPHDLIETIDYVSMLSKGAPFMLALTVQ